MKRSPWSGDEILTVGVELRSLCAEVVVDWRALKDALLNAMTFTEFEVVDLQYDAGSPQSRCHRVWGGSAPCV